MATMRRKDFKSSGASEFEIIRDNSGLYLFLALVLIGAGAAIF
jgi:hypothetical protein